MDVETLDKKRKLLTLLSLTLTILIVAFFAFFIIMFSSYIWTYIIAIPSVLGLLYLLSRFFVYKQYLKLKYEVINSALSRNLKFTKVTNNEEIAKFIYHFYNKEFVNIKSSMTFNYFDLHNITLKEFEVVDKRNFKSDKVTLAGKHLECEIINKTLDFVIILNYHSETNKFIDYYSYYYQNKKEYYHSKTNKQYLCLYNDSYDFSFLDLFEKITDFHMIAIKNGFINVLFIDKLQIFDFKLQKMLTSNTINLCSACFEKTSKIIKGLRKIINNEKE